jgi:hypothetical protein
MKNLDMIVLMLCRNVRTILDQRLPSLLQRSPGSRLQLMV